MPDPTPLEIVVVDLPWMKTYPAGYLKGVLDVHNKRLKRECVFKDTTAEKIVADLLPLGFEVHLYGENKKKRSIEVVGG